MLERESQRQMESEDNITKLKETLRAVVHEQKIGREQGFSASQIAQITRDAIMFCICGFDAQNYDNLVTGLPDIDNLLGATGYYTPSLLNMEIDWKEYQLLRSHQAISGPDAMEAIQYIREKLRLTTDPLAAWQWGYAHLVWMIYTFRNQLYPRFDEIGQYNPPHQPTIVQEDSEHVLF